MPSPPAKLILERVKELDIERVTSHEHLFQHAMLVGYTQDEDYYPVIHLF